MSLVSSEHCVCPLGVSFPLCTYNHFLGTGKSRWYCGGGGWQGCAVRTCGSEDARAFLNRLLISKSLAMPPQVACQSQGTVCVEEGPVVGEGRDPGKGWPNICPGRGFKLMV